MLEKKIFIDAVYPGEKRIVMLKDNNIELLEYDITSRQQITGNIYLARVTGVEKSLQAAFVEFENGVKQGFLPFSEIHPDNYNISEEEKEVISKEILKHKLKKSNLDIIDSNLMLNLDLIDLLDEKKDNNYDMTLEADKEVSSLPPQDEYKYKQNNILNKYRIENVIKKDQIILVQVTKDERGNKGASLTTYISLVGKYCVYMPNSNNTGGVSRKINGSDNRNKLRNLANKLTEDNPKSSLILRTSAGEVMEDEIIKDFHYLKNLWNMIYNFNNKQKIIPIFLHSEGDLIKKIIRDNCDNTVSEILIHGEEAFSIAKNFINAITPSDMPKLKQYKGKLPIFAKYRIEDKIQALYDKIVYLKSGASIIIDQTEALISIDVNSGKQTSGKNIEETALNTNLEAVDEIAKQLKLRDLGGLIVIDFIDMEEIKNRAAVEKKLKDALSLDKARIRIGKISNFGLLEMSRQRLKQSFLELNTKKCHYCTGTGFLKNQESVTLHIIRSLESELHNFNLTRDNKNLTKKLMKVTAHMDNIIEILNKHREKIIEMENIYNMKIEFSASEDLNWQLNMLDIIDQTSKEILNKKPSIDQIEHYETMMKADANLKIYKKPNWSDYDLDKNITKIANKAKTKNRKSYKKKPEDNDPKKEYDLILTDVMSQAVKANSNKTDKSVIGFLKKLLD